MDLVRHPEYLTKTNLSMSYTSLHPRLYNPYPDRTSKKWQAASLAPFVECDSPWNGTGLTDDIKVFVGRPKDFPKPAFGSSGLLDIDSKLCFEREGRLGAYGYGMDNSTAGPYINWDSVNWGSLQDQCVKRNAARFHLNSKSEILDDTPPHDSGDPRDGWAPIPGETVPEKKAVPRTAILLRSFSGKVYTENDKQNIRSIINELGLRSGGEYEVFLLVQVKDPSIKLWTNNAVDNAAYEKAKRDLIPAEFQSIAHLWDDAVVQSWYPEIPKNVANVEKSQWLSVQRFANRHPSFDYFWNWEIDSRYTGHHYDLLTKIVDFARSQPRRGLWERNERFYIKDFHGPWLTKFRYTLADMYENNIVWGAPKVPDVTPVGPTPPPGAAKDEGYHWGVDEEADYISLAPIFNPENTGWNGSTDVWGYESGADSLPRRATIITQSRCSRRLLDLMHRENLLGKHIGSQMTPQTVALLHSLKAVYAPHPVFMDREWDGETLQKWFNSGPKGESGSGNESPFGWGREDRFRGSTWYFKAEAAIKLFNHWMGWEDGGIGGVEVCFDFIHSTLNFIFPFLVVMHSMDRVEPKLTFHSGRKPTAAPVSLQCYSIPSKM